ncbi:hypothetical protein G4B88_009009 [Cannabis sativa]|uniref:Rapid ALkalinization Factor n=2 Tax=Cannabis sativa TaxID=3483 RepID=A0A7J6HPH9_CANSA|nr:hypothetical protein G4B88_009009 [Cannabis sativa]
MMKMNRVVFVAIVLSIMLVVSEAASGPSKRSSADKNDNNNTKKFINPGVLDPCQKPGGPHKGCSDPNAKRTPSNEYNRGCFNDDRCRH